MASVGLEMPARPIGPAAGGTVMVNGELASALFRAHRPALIGFLARRLNGNVGLAEDLAQEAIVRIAAAPRPYSGERAQHLLYRIASNILIDHFRSEKTRRNAMSSLTIVGDGHQQTSPHCELAHRDDVHLVRETILALPPRCREVYLLHRFEEMSYAAIAAHCGISISMVEKHMHKALLRLADALRRQEIDE